jgi:AcrR family transcriptional regulator
MAARRRGPGEGTSRRARAGRGAPGRRRVPREVREGEMLAAAAKVFGEHGYHGASMDEIAAAAGITKPMLYVYFGSKEGLFAACGEQAVERLRAAVRDAGALHDVPPDQRLWRGLLSVFELIGENRELWSVFNPPGGGPAPGPAGEIAVHGRGALAELLGEVVASAAVEQGIGADAAAQSKPMAHALTAAVMATVEWWLQHPEEPKELQALRVMNLVWVGFEQMLAGRLWLPGEP